MLSLAEPIRKALTIRTLLFDLAFACSCYMHETHTHLLYVVCLRQQPMAVTSSQQLWKQQHFTSQQQPESVLQLSPVQHPVWPAAAQPVAWCLAACIGVGPLLAWSSWFCTSSASSLPQPPHPAEFDEGEKGKKTRSSWLAFIKLY